MSQTICTLLIIGIFALKYAESLELNPQEPKNHYDENDIRNAYKNDSIVCYECNSEYDPRCGDPFEPYSIGEVNCSMKRPLEHIIEEFPQPSLCRKTVQKVQGKIRVIRGCGYVPSDRDNKECVKRSGTHDVQVLYCSCNSSNCNGAHLETRPSISVIMLGAILLGTSAFQLA